MMHGQANITLGSTINSINRLLNISVCCVQKDCWKFFGVEYVQQAELCSEDYNFRNMRMYEFFFSHIFKIVIFSNKNLCILKCSDSNIHLLIFAVPPAGS